MGKNHEDAGRIAEMGTLSVLTVLPVLFAFTAWRDAGHPTWLGLALSVVWLTSIGLAYGWVMRWRRSRD